MFVLKTNNLGRPLAVQNAETLASAVRPHTVRTQLNSDTWLACEAATAV